MEAIIYNKYIKKIKEYSTLCFTFVNYKFLIRTFIRTPSQIAILLIINHPLLLLDSQLIKKFLLLNFYMLFLIFLIIFYQYILFLLFIIIFSQMVIVRVFLFFLLTYLILHCHLYLPLFLLYLFSIFRPLFLLNIHHRCYHFNFLEL